MRRRMFVKKLVLTLCGALLLPLALGSARAEGGPLPGEGVEVDTGIMLAGPDSPAPEALPITPLPEAPAEPVE